MFAPLPPLVFGELILLHIANLMMGKRLDEKFDVRHSDNQTLIEMRHQIFIALCDALHQVFMPGPSRTDRQIGMVRLSNY